MCCEELHIELGTIYFLCNHSKEKSCLLHHIHYSFKAKSFSSFRFAHIPTTKLTVTSAEKFIFICLPLKARNLCTIPNAKKVMIALVVTFTLFDARWFYIINAKESASGSVSCTTTSIFAASYNDLYKYFDSLIYSYLPIAFMTLFNVAIILKLALARFQNKTESSSLSKAAKGITVMLIGASVLFITCTLPYAIVYSIDSNLSTYVYAVQAILVYINHSVNIIVYGITNGQFNKELRKLVGCKRNKIESTSTNQLSMN